MKIGEIGSLQKDEVKQRYKTYLVEQNLTSATVNTALTYTFYIWRYSGETLFWDVVTDDDFDTRVKVVLHDLLVRHSKGNPDKLVSSYVSHLRRFRKFLVERPSQEDELIEVAEPHNLLPVEIPNPSVEEVKNYLDKWAKLEDYSAQEDALDKLFQELSPNNTDLSDVLIKTATLNDFYSTNIFSIFPVARHIVELDIDERLRTGCVSLVDEIKKVTISGKKKSFYSFATKYCSHHNDVDFPIYDSYVDKVLWHYRKRDGFSNFSHDELKTYKRFKEILIEFQKYYGLEQFNLKHIDQYLWQFGKTYFPKKY